MAQNKRGQQWTVVDGKAVLVTPAVAAESTPVSSKRLDRQIGRLGQQKARAEAELVTVQTRLDALTTEEADLVALRAQVDDDPEPE